jgi:Ni/Fe-hydrogenase 1 B-type cytochrome subunit
MAAPKIQRILVWSRALRIAHWLMALSVLVLLATGWSSGLNPVIAETARDYHYIAGAVLILALALRLYLLFFGRGSDLLADCETDRHRLTQAGEMLRFYLSLGRTPLPRWYAHNPLWGPIYLLLFLFLLLQALSGVLLLQGIGLFAGLSLYGLHQLVSTIILGFTLLHLAAVFSHDAKGSGADNSAMISGYRIFLIEDRKPEFGAPQVVPLEQLRRQLSDQDGD